MSEKLIESLAQGGILGLILGLVILHQGRQFNVLSSKIAELIGLLRERFKIGIMVSVLTLGLVSGCSSIPVGVEICVMHPEYGKVCGKLENGKVTVTADVELPPELQSKIEDQIRKLGGSP